MKKPNKRELWELRQMQSLPLSLKIRMTEERIRGWYNHFGGDIYISFSGGKDSTVLLDIARKLYPDIEAVFVDTGLEYPEVRDHVKAVDNVTWLKPVIWDRKKRQYVPTNFKEVILQYGYPVISKEVAECVQDARKSIRNNDGKYTYRLKRLNGELLDKDGNKSKYNMKKWRFLLDAPFDISNYALNFINRISVAIL